MSLSRRNAVLLALVAAFALAEVALAPDREARPRPVAVLPDLESADVATVRIERGGERVELARVGPERRWVVRERHDYPAHQAAVRELLARLAGLRSDDVVATDRSSHAVLGFGPEEVRVELDGASGEPLARLVVAAAPGGRGAHVRLAERDEVHRAAALGVVDPSPRHWLDTRAAAFDVGAVEALRIDGRELGGEVLTLEREADGRWRVADEERRLVGADVNPLLVAAANLYFEDVVAADREGLGLDPPAWRVALELADGAPVVLELGDELAGESEARAPAPARALARPGWSRPWVVRLPGPSAARLRAAIERVRGAGS